MRSDFDYDIDNILSEFLGDTKDEDFKQDETPASSSYVSENIETDDEYDIEIDENRLYKEIKFKRNDTSDIDADEFFETHKIQKKKSSYEASKQGYERERLRKSGISPLRRFSMKIVGFICAAFSVVILLWAAVNVHPATTMEITTEAGSTADIVSRLNNKINNSKSEILKGLVFIKKNYSIPESATGAYEPNAYAFGEVALSNAKDIENVIRSARDSGLLDDDERVVFSPDAEFYYDKDIKYYLDDTLMCICWKEVIDGNTCTFSEIKVADASQFRRKFVNDTFGADAQDYCSNIAKSVNAVVAMNADYYAFRDFGLVVYQRQLFRMNEGLYSDNIYKYNCVDTLFVDENGDFSFFHRGEETTNAAMRKYIQDNNILFSIAFGPILVENGELKTCDSYPAGEVNSGYSRAGIAQVGERHYLYMSLNHSDEKAARWTVNEFAQHFYDKGVINAYCLDGGQTSEIVFNGEPYNYIDFNAERTVTDIIYFGTAISDTSSGG